MIHKQQPPHMSDKAWFDYNHLVHLLQTAQYHIRHPEVAAKVQEELK